MVKMAMTDELDALLLPAVRLGDINSLETCLSSVSNPSTYIDRIHEDSEQQKCTLLMIACLNDYQDIVRTLLESFQADTEILNDIKVSIKDQNFKVYENVTVLWAVAALNNFELVKLLVEHGARVNHTTKTNSTAIRCACFHGNLPMVRYLVEHQADIHIAKEHNDTNLILSVFRQHAELVEYLIDELGCDVNECDNEGRSSLYLAVERGSLELVQLLLKRDARNFSATYDQMSPLMLAAEKRRNDLVDSIVPSCSYFEQIQAEELLGSAFACLEHGDCDLEKSFEHLTRACQLRTIYQLPKVLNTSTHEVFNHRQECRTIDELESIRSMPDHMYIEALLIRERLLGPSNLKYRNSLLYRGATLAHTSQYLKGIALWMYGLELHQQWSIPVSAKQLRYFVKIFATILNRGLSIPIRNFCQLIKITMDTLDRDAKEFDDNLHTLLFTITMTSEILMKTQIIDADQRMLCQSIHSINQHRYVTRGNGSSLLHLSLSDSTLSSNGSIDQICKYPSLSTIRLLLQCGADVNASNNSRETPVHVFVSNSDNCNESILQLLCDAGAHLDCANALGETPMDSASDVRTRQLLRARIKLNLKCLCARFIRKNKISFHGKIGHSLAHFVEQH